MTTHYIEQVAAETWWLPMWRVRVGEDLRADDAETYVLRAGDSEHAAFEVAGHLGFACDTEDDWLRMMRFRDKRYATDLRLDDGRFLSAEAAVVCDRCGGMASLSEARAETGGWASLWPAHAVPHGETPVLHYLDVCAGCLREDEREAVEQFVRQLNEAGEPPF